MRIIYFSIVVVLILNGVTAFGTSYYVSTTGANTNPGTLAFPFATIQHGSNQLLPGDSLLIRGGTYFEKIYLNTTGAVNDPIVISAYNGEAAVVDGSGVTGLEMLTIFQRDYVTINGLVFQNNFIQYAKGIFVNAECSNIMISN